EMRGEAADRVDGARVGVGAADGVAFAEEVDEVAAAAAAGVEDAHAGRDAAAQELIEQVDVDAAELLGQGGHRGLLLAFEDAAERAAEDVGLRLLADAAGVEHLAVTLDLAVELLDLAAEN